ncbi:MAG: 4Fe-4S binding protein [Armatimonadetes bacterium]|nr:4Fe-4S binding protein [Armatimonadota bacterium]
MPIRKLVAIDEEKCDGCGLCAKACHEGAIRIIDGKARLVSESYCDGLGDCLGECPRGAITIEERQAAPYDQNAVDAHLAGRKQGTGAVQERAGEGGPRPGAEDARSRPPRLAQWPVQLMLVPVGAPFLQGADILVTADCVPFASNDFHDRYLAGHALLVGCPKFDDAGHYFEKLKQMFVQAGPRSITVLRMQVPCCGGLANLVTRARDEVVPGVPLSVITMGIRGEQVSEEEVQSPPGA